MCARQSQVEEWGKSAAGEVREDWS